MELSSFCEIFSHSEPDLQGRLDDLRIYSGALGPAEIAAQVQA